MELAIEEVNGLPSLSWTVDSDAGIDKVEVFRAEAGGELHRIRSVEGSRASYVDPSVKTQVSYAYVVRVRLSDGRRSGFSRDVVFGGQ